MSLAWRTPTARCATWFAASFVATVMLSRAVSGQDSTEAAAVKQKLLVGPQTEQRFPRLIVPAGFQTTLFACDPLIEYPSVIALGPRQGTLLVAHDYLTGLGVEIVRRDEVRLIEDTDADGYADRSKVFAKDFNSIQGLAYFGGSVFVMHAPRLTRLRDTDGDGVADERRDLLAGLGLPPQENSNRLHCANGVTAGHDGWLYLALGDRGCDVQRPEGDRLLFQQGGILRCRVDGSDLHVFATGLRNIYDVALDDELNVFVRDNENDGGDYMIRVCHCFFGSDHGYPYHYYERPDEPMAPLANLGRGSSAGGTSYLESAFPREFRESLFFCEWGRAVVRYHKKRSQGGFAEMTELDFAAGAADDPYGFKPTDLVVDYDGSLLVSDWADGQRPKRGRGRIYRIAWGQNDPSVPAKPQPVDRLETDELLQELDASGLYRRLAAQHEFEQRGSAAINAARAALEAGRLGLYGQFHAIWLIANSGSPAALTDLFAVAEGEVDPRVCAQAIRAIGDLTDPILVHNKIDARRGEPQIAERIGRLLHADTDPRVVLEALILWRRLGWAGGPQQIGTSPAGPALDHARVQALRHSGNWPGVLQLLDGPARHLALRALAEQRVEQLVEPLISRLESADDPARRREYADALSRIVRGPSAWEYWGFRPAPRPAASVDWEQTSEILRALNARLADSDREVRSFVLQRMLREAAETEFGKLADWLVAENDPARVTRIREALKRHSTEQVAPLLFKSVRQRTLPPASRIALLSDFVARAPDGADERLVQLAGEVEDGSVLGAVLDRLGQRPALEVDALLTGKLDSQQPIVRAAAIRALGRRDHQPAKTRVARLLMDNSRDVRLAAAEAAGSLGARQTADTLLELAGSADRGLVNASLRSLTELGDGRAVGQAKRGLMSSDTQFAALAYLREFGNPGQLENVMDAATTSYAADFQREIAETLTSWQRRFPHAQAELELNLARLNGHSGQPFAWQVSGPLDAESATGLLRQLAPAADAARVLAARAGSEPGGSDLVLATGAGGQVSLVRDTTPSDGRSWVAWAAVQVPDAMEIEMLASATGRLSIWLNGSRLHHRQKSGAFRPDSDRAATGLRSGMNLVAVQVRSDDKAPRFHLRFRRRSSVAEQERLIQFALKTRGNANRGREVFENQQKAACLRCHRLGEQGAAIGPDLSGIGRRFSRIHLIQSILDPSRTIAPSYATVAVVLGNGRTLTGVRVRATDEVLVIGDNQGKTHEILQTDVDEVVAIPESTMPAGLEKTLTEREFADLLAYLQSQNTQE